MGDSSVYLLLPGLLSSCVNPEALPGDAAPLWCRAFGAARRHTVSESNPVDVAALGYLADFGELPASPCWRCDPVYLQSDTSRVFLFNAVQREIDREEAGELTRAFNNHLADAGLELVFHHPGRWYLFGLPAIDRPPAGVESVVGRDMQAFLPRDPYLARLLTEVQMLFHSLPINNRRQAEGKMPVNGVWIYGRGHLPDPRGGGWQSIYSDSIADRGLAQYTQTPYSAPPESLESLDIPAGGAVLIRSDALLSAGVEGYQFWYEALERLEGCWLEPLWRALKQRRLDRLVIDDGEQVRFCIERRRAFSWRRRLFARSRPLRSWVNEVKS